MKRLLLIIILTLNFQTLAKADNIRDFEIEGVSIGDSLLSFGSEKKIKSIKTNDQYPNDKYIIYEANKLIENTKYDIFTVTTKKNDRKYIITNLSGSIYYKDLNECFKIRQRIRTDVEKLFNFDEVSESKYKSQDGEATVHGLQFYLKPYPSVESIVLNCNHYFDSEQKKRFSITVNPQDFANYLINEAYK
jgi:hypothetical protein